MRRKVDKLEAKTSILSIERSELKNKLIVSETTTTYLTNTQKELEAALLEKESHINQMKENAAASIPDQTTSIKELLQQKEAEQTETSSGSIPAAAEENSNNTTASENSHQDESIAVGANNENATFNTVMHDKSENSNDSVPTPAEEQNSNNTTASESNNKDESIVAGTNHDTETEVPDKYANSTGTMPAPAEEQHSYNTTASENNQQDNSSTEQQFVRLTTNMEDGQLQENKVDGNEHSEDATEGSHSDKSELPQLSQKLTDGQEGSKEQLDGTRQTEDPQGGNSSHSRDGKLLEMEDSNAPVKEAEREMNAEGKPETSEDSSTEVNQNTMQALESVVVPTEANSSMSTNNDERKETSKRHRKRRFRSRRKKRTTVAAGNNDGSHQMEVDAARNTLT
jgi:hypothetical protein